MSTASPPAEFLLLSRGQWHADKTPEEIQSAIDGFYGWYEQLLARGTFKPGLRLATGGMVVSSSGITDGPFTEAREIIGGYWIVVAGSLKEAASIAAQNPCIACGLSFELRPIENVRASAYRASNENAGRVGPESG